MEVSDVRKRVKEVIDRAKRTMTERRTLVDEATREYEVFLDRIATPLFRQIGNVLRAEGHAFTVSTPGSSVRLVSDRSPRDYVELALDTTGRQPQVIIHSSRSRGRRVTESEAPIGTGGPVRDLTEEEVLTAVMNELEPLVTPGSSVRLVSDRSPRDYVELALDTTGRQPQVIIHSSRSRGRRVTESEAPIGTGGPVRDLTEEEVLTAVMNELEPLVER